MRVFAIVIVVGIGSGASALVVGVLPVVDGDVIQSVQQCRQNEVAVLLFLRRL